MEDVLIKVGDFICPMNFMILEIEHVSNPKSHNPVILGWTFLAIINALINYHNGLMTLYFGNMSIDLNNFNLDNEVDQPLDANLIQDNTYEPLNLSNKDFDFNL